MANRFLNNVTINDEYTLPSVDGTADQVIATDGAGNLTFVDAASIVTTAESDLVYYDVKNSSGSTIAKGKAVMAVGTDGNSGHILIDEMVADGSVESKYFIGVLETSLDNGSIGRVIHFGQLDQFNTLGQNGETWSDGDILWLDPVNDGDYTITEPNGPNLKVAAAIVKNAATQGKVHVRVQANEGMHDLHDVRIATQASGDLLVWDNTLSVWKNDATISVDYTNNIVTVDGKIYYSNMFAQESNLPSATTYHGMFAHVHGTGYAYYAHDGDWVKLAKLDDINNSTLTLTAGTGFSGGGTFTTNQSADSAVTVNLADTAVTPGTYGDANNTPQITIDQQGRITSATTVTTAGSGGGGGGGAELTIERNVFTATANQTAFVISSDITASSNTQVYIDGVYQAKDNYTTSGSTVTFSTGVPLGAEVEVVHFISVLSKVYTDTFTGDGSDVTFDASKDVTDENVTQVYIDGVYQSKDNYTTSGTTITFSTAPPNGSAIEVVHFTAAEYSALNSNQFTGTGSQTDFTLTQAVDIDKSFVFIQGIYQEKSTYSITGTTLTFTTAPQSGYTVEVITVGAVSIFNDTLYLDSFTAIHGQANYTLSTTPASENAIDVYLNGIYQNKSTFSLSGSTLTFSSAPTTGTAIEVKSTGGLNNVVSSGAGGIDWQTTPKTSAFTAIAGEGYFVNTTSAAITVTLPSSPSAGDELTIVDYAGTADTNNITITSSDNINGSSNDVKIDYERGGVSMVYVDATQGWIAYNAANETATALGTTPLTVDYLVVAGGGGGGGAGGGGGGGLRTSYTNTSSLNGHNESSLSLDVSTNYTVSVGPGGAGAGTGNDTKGAAGTNSRFGIVGSEITSTGGGGGGGYNANGGSGIDGNDGGSGGGGGSRAFAGTAGLGGHAVTSPVTQGYDGGDTVSNSSSGGYKSSGGGGAGGAGNSDSGSVSGSGGTGLQVNIDGNDYYWAGGGGGGAQGSTTTAGNGGTGGGGGGAQYDSGGTAGTGGGSAINSGGNGTGSTNTTTGGAGGTNTGGGGGGMGVSVATGGAGGSGVIILRYPSAFTISETTSPTVLTFNTYTQGTDKVTVFTSGENGTIEFTT